MTERFVKADTTGLLLPVDATEWVLVLDSSTDLMWSRGFAAVKVKRWKAALQAATDFAIGELTGFRAPSVQERFGISNLTRHSPAIDTRFFDSPDSGWEWTSTLWAPSPADDAWFVYLNHGNSHWNLQYTEGFVRACAPRQSLGISAVPEGAQA
ncbi:MAG TPA: DUF1566 domain-containing protein [Steroidobacteraceae bacterium]|jgi:hypothetical protein